MRFNNIHMNTSTTFTRTKNVASKKYAIILIIIGIFLLLASYVSNAQVVQSTVVRPNILWITCEDMSPHLSSFGEKQIETPNLDALAKEGVKYTNVYTVAGVCAPSRCGIITGMYPQSIGGNNMRNYQPGKRGQEEVTSRVLPSYSIVPPSYVKCFSEFLRKEMYYCTNSPKEDYQFEAPVTAWDESSNKAHWKNRPDGKPFFAVFNLGVTHESQLWIRDSLPLDVDPAKVIVPPYYPDNAETRKTIARQLSNVKEMDRQAGKIIQELKDSGLYNNTIIFFYSDHGDGLPFVKREITKRGLHVPLIIKFPNQLNAGKVDNRLISGIDMAPTALSIAGVTIPGYMQGKAFLGEQQKPERKYIFAARDRMDGEVDRVRSVFDGKYQYLRNYMPQNTFYQNIVYRLQIPMMKKMVELKDAGKLNATQMKWFQTKPIEELYDTEKDPFQFNNLATNPAYKNKLKELKAEYDKWMNEVGDLHTMPELELRNKMWGNDKEAPVTAKPELVKVKDGYVIKCQTPGASIGYILLPKNGKNKMGGNSYKVYHYGSQIINPGDYIKIVAHRIGYTASITELTMEN
jgi:arylsulfatase A-like enzyme